MKITDVTLCAYQPGSYNVATVFDLQGKSIYSDRVIFDYVNEGCEIMPLDDAVDLIEGLNAAQYDKPWEETTKEDYWEMLEVLPPEAYEGGCFRLCEYWTGTYTTHYIKRGERYYTAVRKAMKGWGRYQAELEQQLKESAQ